MGFLFPTDWKPRRWAGDLTLDEMLSDPLVRVVMRADRVDPRKLEAELRRTADALEQLQSPPQRSEERCMALC